MYAVGFHNCALSLAHTLQCLGWNRFKQLDYPTDFHSGEQALALGRLHSCGISKYGLLQCWGGKQDEGNNNIKVVNDEDIKVITNLKLSTRGIRFIGFNESSTVLDVRDITNVHT